ncbi:MAG: TolC family protein, partial [Alphaproteobacteria bacterium]|nr:TolC family protein [Alphaproteobacteria bacterium]
MEMVDQGMSDEAELQQARDVSMIIDSLKAEYEGQLISAEAAYIKAVGIPASQKMIIPDNVRIYVEKDIDEIITQVKSSHPLVRSTYMRSVAAKHAVDAEEGKLYPDLTGELTHSKIDKKDAIGGESIDSRAVVKMKWSFSTGGKELSSINRKRAEYLETVNKVEEIKRNVEKGIREAYARYLTYWRKTTLSQKRVELNQKLMSTYQSQFEGSRISLLALMRAQSQLFKAKLENNDNSYNLLSAQYGTLGARGELTDILLDSEMSEE